MDSNEIGKIILTEGLFVSSSKNDIDEYIKGEEEHSDLIKNIGLIMDRDPLFFSFTGIGDYDFLGRVFEIIWKYQQRYKNNSDICHNVMNKVNSLNMRYPIDRKRMQIRYVGKQQIDRDRSFKSLDEMFDCIKKDAIIYDSIVSGTISDVDDADTILDSVIYFANKYSEMFEDENIYDGGSF